MAHEEGIPPEALQIQRITPCRCSYVAKKSLLCRLIETKPNVNLIVDQGNTICKLAVFDGCDLQMSTSVKALDRAILRELFLRYESIDSIIYSSVGADDASSLAEYVGRCRHFVELKATTAVPIRASYDRRQLGGDRLAAVVGAYSLAGRGESILVIDAGTAITYEYLEGGNHYIGGNISPGLWLRFKALGSFTSRLPLIHDLPDTDIAPYGVDTHSAMVAGCVEGLMNEVRGYIRLAQEKGYRVILTGGDSEFIAERLGSEPFEVQAHLVLVGLNEILNYNKQNI